MSVDKTKLINGPINVIRIEQTINKINKVLYLFLDYHLPINSQSKCDNFESIDIVNYFNNIFSESIPHTLDFFMEVQTLDIKEYDEKEQYIKKTYIAEVNKFFIKNFKSTKLNKSIRFHYFDIRDKFDMFLNYKINSMNEFIINMNTMYEKYKLNFETFKSELTFCNEYIEIISLIFQQKPYESYLGNYSQLYIEYLNDLNKTVHKLITKYNNQNIKSKLDKLISYVSVYITELKQIIEQIFKNIESYTKLNKFDRKSNNIINFDEESILNNLYNITILFKRFKKNIVTLHSVIIDCYFIKRFCDKDYITHAIIYSGGNHSARILKFLICELDFKITHISNYSDTKLNPTYITQKIKTIKGDNVNDELNSIKKIIFPQDMTQCSDLTTFPDNFS